jgi:hypothetical protein
MKESQATTQDRGILRRSDSSEQGGSTTERFTQLRVCKMDLKKATKKQNERKLEATDTHYTHVSKRSHPRYN